MAGKLNIVGIGPGSIDYIYPAATKLIAASDVLVGGKRNLALFRHLHKEEVVIGANLSPLVAYILEHISTKTITVLASGDPGVFSIAAYLQKKLPNIEQAVYPGISSLQYLCAKVHTGWDDLFIASLHGRELENLVALVHKHSKVLLFTGGDTSPASVCQELSSQGLGEVTVTVGERLSYPEEKIVTGSPLELGRMEFDSLAIMLIEQQSQALSPNKPWEATTSGVPDHMFIRGKVPMTKEEIRTITLAKLMLREDAVVYDIGAGTGSVSIECGLKIPQGRVYAIEKDPEALELIKANVAKFGLDNVTVVEGLAPEILAGLPVPDRIFIGGTAGRMESILNWVASHCQKLRIVVNAVTLETAYEALNGLTSREFSDVDITGVGVTKGRLVGKKHLMEALNPIYIISGEK